MKSKKTIVFLCGLTCDERVWSEVSDTLSLNYNTQIISFKGLDSISNMAKKVLNEVSDDFILIGHSMGGRVALEVYNQNPQRVLALGLFNTGVHPRSEKEVPGRLELLDLAKCKGMTHVVKKWLPPMMGKSSFENYELISNLENMVSNFTIEDYEKQVTALLNRPDATKVLPNIKVPTLLLSAVEDLWSPFSQHKSMSESIQNSTLVEIEDAGHMVICEKPELIAKEIDSWINKIKI